MRRWIGIPANSHLFVEEKQVRVVRRQTAFGAIDGRFEECDGLGQHAHRPRVGAAVRERQNVDENDDWEAKGRVGSRAIAKTKMSMMRYKGIRTAWNACSQK